MRCLWDVWNRSPLREISQKPLRNISKHLKRLFYDVFKTSQIHLKKDVFQVTSLGRLRHISKKIFILWRLWYVSKNISWKYLWLFKNNTQKWFLAGKINVWALKTLRKMKRRFLWAMHSHQSVCRVDSYLHVVAVFQISGAGVLFTFFAFTCF